MKKQSGTAPMSNNAELKQLLLDKEIELRDAKRQLEVEVALEKVRSLTMVMKRSDDLSDIILIVYKELRKLDIALTRTLIWLFNENPDMFEVWMADTEADTTPFVMKQEVEHPYHKRMFDAWKKRRSKWVYINEGEGKKDLDDYLFTKTAAVALPEEVKAGIRALNRIVNSFSFHNFGCLQADGAEELSEENFEIMYRFAKEFDLAYIRFLDLKKAEALAREAQIEASLERVRARSMAMHNSEELLDVAKQLYQELEDLGVPQYMTGFVEVDKINQKQKVWVTAPNGQRMESFFLPLKGDAILKTRHNSWLKQDPIFYQKVTGEALKKHLLYVSKHYESAEAVEIGNQFPDKIIFYCGNFSEGYLHILSEVKLDKEQESILQKFTKVFSITYRRFLDLKLAEEQAREAKIEAALEQVRTRSMAMHSSEELSEVAYVLFEKLKELGVQLQWCWFSIFDEDLKGMKAWYTDTDGQFNPTPIHQKIKDFEDVGSVFKAWKDNTPICLHEIKGPALVAYVNELGKNPVFRKGPTYRTFKKNISGCLYQTHAIFKQGYIGYSSFKPRKNETLQFIGRFAKSLEQTYTRFLELQKAEAQAREAQIEAALERVRSKSIGMQKSEELKEVIRIIFDQLALLDINAEHAGIVVDYKAKQDWNFWIAETQNIPSRVTVPYLDSLWDRQYVEAKEKGKDFFATQFNFEEKNRFYHELLKYIPGLTKKARNFYLNCPGLAISTVIQENIGLYIENFSGTPYSDDENNILMRFGKVFQQTYTRFMDLKKAEEQAREAQIEASLERVRGRAMALQKSDELHEVIVVIHEELRKMGMDFYDCNIYILSKDEKEFTCWGSELGEVKLLTEIKLEINAHPVIGEIYTEFKKGNKYTSDNISGKKLKDLGNWLVSETDYKQAPEEYKKAMLEPDQIVFSRAFMNHGLLEAAGSKILPDDQAEILKRFANVIDLTYTRYDDLVQAEAQAREAQIEAGLERIRASTMAMHKSEQLSETAMVLFDQFYQLGQVPDRISIAVYNEKQKSFDFRVTDQSGLQLSESYGASIQEPTTVNKIYKAWKNKKKSTVIKLTGQKLKNWISFVKDDMKLYVDEKNIQGRRIHYAAFFSQGFLLYTSNTEMEPDFINLLIRFAKVFDQTYTRFLDLKKAEIQAREAQIEASLERVRARAMAMQKSDELRDVVGLVSEELNISLENTICIIMNFDWKSKEIEWWSTGFNIDNLPESYKIPIRDTIKDHPLIRHYQEALRKGISYIVYKLEGEIKRSWDKYVFEQSELSKIPLETQNWMRSYEGVICNEAFMSHGVLEVDGPEQLSDENAEILQRFAKVVDLTYTRVEDLQQAEARAIEAVRQASLDRVRGVIASMRTKEDLNRITPLIWKELKALDVPFIRCGVFIMDVENEIIQSYLSTPDGKTLGVFNLPFTSELIGELMVDFWQKGKIYKEHWTAERFVEFTQRLKESGQLKDSDSYQGAAAPPEKLDLHFIPFKQGMLYVGNTAPLTKDELQLVKSLAEAFSIAYARYEDFRELELAKNQIESTLNELKSTQSQLIHAEKMASLGELTAGIAHEIQNPLNFVNNFSEVSVDLIEELKAERGKEDREREESLEVEILDDVIQNLEKINHHGQRASSIVKGMLEHSRTGSKDKQLTDINLLADEYLRLAYHGLRAKDKSFNADFSLVKDDKLPEIKVIPQDIGRVLLNLINNAFYAVSNKAKQGIQNFKPQVIVSTKAMNKAEERSAVEIKVKDNGNGIPRDILEKIFQPFFTTKPAGKGTGLGLSLSYDIIKAHGGEISVKSVEGEGSEFTIVLGINTN